MTIVAIKDGYKRAIYTLPVSVGKEQGSVKVSKSLLIGKPNEQLFYTITTLDKDYKIIAGESQSDKVTIEIRGNEIQIAANKEGYYPLAFTIVDQEGNEVSRLSLGVGITGKLSNSKDMIKNVVANWEGLSEDEKTGITARQMVLEQCNILIEALSKVSIKDNKVKITKNDVKKAIKQMEKTRHELIGSVEKLNIQLNQDILSTITFQLTTQEQYGDHLKVTIDKKELEDLQVVDKVYVSNEDGIAIGLTKELIKELGESYNQVTFEVMKTSDGYEVKMYDEVNTIKVVDHTIELRLPVHTADEIQSLHYTNSKQQDINIGGAYSSKERAFVSEIKHPGEYTLREMNDTYQDLEQLSPQDQKKIAFLLNKGVLEPGEANKFNADEWVTREMFAMTMVKVFYALDFTAECTLSDVQKEAYHYPYIASAEKEKIVEGYQDGTFKGRQLINKEQLLAIASRGLREKGHYKMTESTHLYLSLVEDRESISQWAENEVALAIREELVHIPTDGRIACQDYVTKLEMAQVIFELWFKLNGETYLENVSNDEAIHVSHVSASSTLKPSKDGKYNYDATKALDHQLATVWSEGAVGDGIGEWIQMSLQQEGGVQGIKLYNGHFGSEELYHKNNRVKGITVIFSDGSQKVFNNLNDDFQQQNLDFGGKVSTSYIRIRIDSVYKGNKYEDTCIAEMEVY